VASATVPAVKVGRIVVVRFVRMPLELAVLLVVTVPVNLTPTWGMLAVAGAKGLLE